MKFFLAHGRESLESRLADPDYYLRAISRLHQKYYNQNTGKVYAPAEEGYNLMQAFLERRRVAKLLASDVSSGRYQFSPTRINHITTAEKRRKIFSFTLTDQIVNTAVYLMLVPEIQPYFSPHVHSYIKGRSKVTALQAFMDHLRAHRRAHPEIKTRGLFVLRSDIKSYGESIPVADGAPLWSMIDNWFTEQFGVLPTEHERMMLVHAIRPQVKDADGNIYEPKTGIPDGAPITALLLNLYAKPLDDALSAIEGGFYARFGDDFLFAHPDKAVLEQAAVKMRGILAGLGLRCNEKKTQQFFLNGAARPKDGVKGVSYVEYLGCQLHFNGTIGLKRDKLRPLLKDLRARIQATVKASAHEPFEVRARLASHIVNQTLKAHSVFAHPTASALKRLVSDRSQLRWLDKYIAQLLMRELTGSTSVKQFRLIPYRTIRGDWGVESLEYARN